MWNLKESKTDEVTKAIESKNRLQFCCGTKQWMELCNKVIRKINNSLRPDSKIFQAATTVG